VYSALTGIYLCRKGGGMPRKSQRAQLILSEAEIEILTKLSMSRTAEKREIDRSKILLGYVNGKEISQIAIDVDVSRPTVYKCIDKALATGVETGLKDKYHRPHESVITDEAKAWVIHLACTKPTEHGYAVEVWSHSALAAHVRQHAVEFGHPCLQRAVKATVWRILEKNKIRPHKIRYYMERRDEKFEEKMHDVLMIYKEVEAQRATGNKSGIITVSVDEKPGVQAIGCTAPDLPPKIGKHTTWSRDYEYKRFGTVSILAALDIQTGHVIGQVHRRHRSREFIELLKALDEHYPKDHQIRVILDNHSAHISKETTAYLGTRPNRFLYVHTPKHGAWLNLVETLFGKMARTFLKGIRVKSIEELEARILKGIQEINESPVIYRWKKFDFASA